VLLRVEDPVGEVIENLPVDGEQRAVAA